MFIVTREKTVLSGEAIDAYLRCKFTAGKAVKADATDLTVGVNRHDVFAADKPCTLELMNCQGTIPMMASAAVNKYALVYGANAGKISATPNSNLVGMAFEAASGDNHVIEVWPLQGVELHVGEISAAVAASAAITATLAETVFSTGTFAIAANSLAVGDVLRVRLQGIATATNSTDTLNAKLKIGSVEVAATGAINATNDDIFYMDVDIVVRTIGAGGTIVAAGVVGIGVEGTVTAKPLKKASATLDTTAASDITVTGTWSTADAGNSCRLDVLNVQKLSLAA